MLDPQLQTSNKAVMLRLLSVLIAGNILTQPVAAAPAAPAGKWTVNFADDNCIATRLYQVDSKEVALALKPTPMSDGMRIMLQGKGLQRGISYARVRVHAGEERLAAKEVTVYPSAKAGRSVYAFGALREEVEKLAAAQRLQVVVRGKPRLDLQVVELPQVLKLLDSCISDLLVGWGLSKADQSRIATPPYPTSALFRGDDYPAKALAGSAVGDVEVRAWVDREGKVSNCQVIRSSGHKSLDEVTCRSVLRARLKPAEDRFGQPMASPYYVQTAWRIMN